MNKIVLLLFLLTSFPLFAQRKGTQTLLLNDGSQVTGTIVSDSMGVYKVQVIEPQEVIVNKSQVSSIKTYYISEQFNPWDKGYYIHFTSSLLAGKNDWGDTYTMSFQLSNGFQLSKGFSLGLGSGIESFDVPLIPLYADICYHPFNWRVSPNIYLRTGYSFALVDEETIYYTTDIMYNDSYPKGGFLFNAGIGLTMFTWNRAAVTLGLGYRYQKVTVSRYNYWWSSTSAREQVTYFNRFELKLGFLFR